jgi:hypothetical protein
MEERDVAGLLGRPARERAENEDEARPVARTGGKWSPWEVCMVGVESMSSEDMERDRGTGAAGVMADLRSSIPASADFMAAEESSEAESSCAMALEVPARLTEREPAREPARRWLALLEERGGDVACDMAGRVCEAMNLV